LLTFSSCSQNTQINNEILISTRGFNSWSYQRTITINNSSVDLYNYQIKVQTNIGTFLSGANSNGSDIRFTQGNNGVPLSYWKQTYLNNTAIFWVKVPTLPRGISYINMFYGNQSANSLSNGDQTFDYFDDFETPNYQSNYFSLGQASTSLTQQGWERSAPHTMSVAEMNPSSNGQGFRYWGYYGLQFKNSSGYPFYDGGIGLARSNDLISWQRLPNASPFWNGVLIRNTEGERWPSVLRYNNITYMAHTMYYNTGGHNSKIILRTSSDGINFSAPTEIVPEEQNAVNQNPNLFLDPQSNKFFLYYYRGITDFYPVGLRDYYAPGRLRWEIRYKSANSIEGLALAPSNLLYSSQGYTITSPSVLAAPSMLYFNNKYYLTVETLEGCGWYSSVGCTWYTRAFSSLNPTSGFQDIPANPILGNGQACFFQHIFNNSLHAYYCKQGIPGDNNTWTLEHRSASLTSNQLVSTYNLSKWTATGGSWYPVSAIQANGELGTVLRGSTLENHQLLLSKTIGSDYTIEADGMQISGRVWGIGFRTLDEADLYSVNLYEDLDNNTNLWAYGWGHVNNGLVGNANVGVVNLN
jgi:hypothetical protein